MSQQRDSILMVSLEALRVGSASATHFAAVSDGLIRAGHSVDKYVSRPTRWPRGVGVIASDLAILLRSLRYARVYARWHVLSLSAIALALLGKRVILEVNGTTEDILIAHPRMGKVRRYIEWLAKQQFKHASGIVAVSSGIAEWISRISGAENVRVAPNGGDLGIAKHRSMAQSPPYAVFVGELAPWQGVETILEAKKHTEWPDGVDLVVVGDGALKQAVRREGAAGTLTYIGRLPQPEALKILAGATVSLSPQLLSVSRNHVMGRPLKISESLLLGVPCIATAFPDIKQLLSAMPGSSVIPTDDPGSLARAVGQAVETNDTQRTETARLARELCSWDSAVGVAEELLFEGCAGEVG